MKLPSSSKLDRTMRCPASHVLPQTQDQRPSEAKNHGIEVHGFLALSAEAGRDFALEQIEDEDTRLLCASIDLDRLPAGQATQYSAELRLWWNPPTDQVGTGDPPPGVNLIGIADTAAVNPQTATVYCGDYKTGRGWQPSAEASWQLRSLALMLAKLHNAETAEVEYIMIHDGIITWRDRATFDTLDLDDTEEALRNHFRELGQLAESLAAGQTPAVTIGPWCRYCPAYTACPGQTRLLHAATSDPEAMAQQLRELLTPETAGDAYVRWAAAYRVLGRLKDAIDDFARENGPIPIGNGILYGPRERSREALVGETVRGVLTQLYDEELALKATKVSVTATKEDLKRALRPQAYQQKRGVTQLVNEVLAAVREQGGTHTKRWTVLTEHKAPKKK